MCDAAYVIQLDRLERLILAEQQAVATFRAAGAKLDDPRTFDEARAAFDDELASDPAKVNPELRLLRELGIA